MSHGKTREGKDCLNCGHLVEEKFCPNCGQENSENRKPFHYLFTHFVEDFTHYDGQFWGTIKNLLFKPGKLTETYIEGKRQQFVPPVKLYIFMSFITFFSFAIFTPYSFNLAVDKKDSKGRTISETGTTEISQIQNELNTLKAQKIISVEDSMKISNLTAFVKDPESIKKLKSKTDLNTGLGAEFTINGFKNAKSYDSAQAKNPKFWDFINTPIYHKVFELKENGVKKGDILKNLAETLLHNLPKALFLYLPIFALFLWIFHNKKKWWYFEHGVFTLHYFSFLLLIILVTTYLGKLPHLTGSPFLKGLIYLSITVILIYSILYFFIAHRRVYKLSTLSSNVIGFTLLFINYMAFGFLLIGLAIISFLMIH